MEDPFENMREQMNRQRDEFFNQHPRDWPSDRNGFMNKVIYIYNYRFMHKIPCQ